MSKNSTIFEKTDESIFYDSSIALRHHLIEIKFHDRIFSDAESQLVTRQTQRQCVIKSRYKRLFSKCTSIKCFAVHQDTWYMQSALCLVIWLLWFKANVTLNDFLRRFATKQCCHKNLCNITCHCERFSAYPEKRQHVACFWLELKNSQRCCQNFASQPGSAMGCYTGTIFSATSLQIVSLKSLSVTLSYTKENATWTNQKTTLLLNRWPRTITETMAIATKFMKFFAD